MPAAEKRPVIYGLYDFDGKLRYIGKANDAGQRLKSHMRDCRRRNTPLYAWIRKHGRPEIRVLEVCSEDWREAEKRHIRKALEEGVKLLNLAEGGDEPFCSLDVRRRNAREVANAIHSDPVKKEKWARKQKAHSMMVSSLKQGFVSEATKEKMRQRLDVFAAFERYL